MHQQAHDEGHALPYHSLVVHWVTQALMKASVGWKPQPQKHHYTQCFQRLLVRQCPLKHITIGDRVLLDAINLPVSSVVTFPRSLSLRRAAVEANLSHTTSTTCQIG